MTYISVDLPSEIRPGEWWQWGTFDTEEKAIEALWSHGIHVDEEGRLDVLTVLVDGGEEED